MRGGGPAIQIRELKAVIGPLAGLGAALELEYGGSVLLHPDRTNAYVKAVIQKMQADEHQHGWLPHKRRKNAVKAKHSAYRTI